MNYYNIFPGLPGWTGSIKANPVTLATNGFVRTLFLIPSGYPDGLLRKVRGGCSALVKYVEQAVNDYNNRPHHVLHGLTPIEVLNGQIPDPQAYTSQTQFAKATRINENKKIKCCYHGF